MGQCHSKTSHEIRQSLTVKSSSTAQNQCMPATTTTITNPTTTTTKTTSIPIPPSATNAVVGHAANHSTIDITPIPPTTTTTTTTTDAGITVNVPSEHDSIQTNSTTPSQPGDNIIPLHIPPSASQSSSSSRMRPNFVKRLSNKTNSSSSTLPPLPTPSSSSSKTPSLFRKKNRSHTSHTTTPSPIPPSSSSNPPSTTPLSSSTTSPPSNPLTHLLPPPPPHIWSQLYQTHHSHLVDPADYTSLIDELVSQKINLLSPAELLRLQRRIRLVRRSDNSKNAPNSKKKKDNGNTSIKHRVLEEVHFRKALLDSDDLDSDHPPPSLSHSKSGWGSVMQWQRKENGTSGGAMAGQNHEGEFEIDVYGSAYVLLSGLNEGLWEDAAKAAQLVMEEGKDGEEGSVSKEVPPLPLNEAAEGGTPPSGGVSFYGFCYYTAVLSRGSLEEKLCWLFHLLVPPGILRRYVSSLSPHLPTVVLEMGSGSETLLSYASIMNEYSPRLTIDLEKAIVALKDLLGEDEEEEEEDENNEEDDNLEDTTPATTTGTGNVSIPLPNDSPPPPPQSALQQLSTLLSTRDTSHPYTLPEFLSLAKTIPSSLLSPLFTKLTGHILLTPSDERQLVRNAWDQWDQTAKHYWKNPERDDVTETSPNFGGFDGLDGRAGLGHGILYVLPHRWWTQWNTYTTVPSSPRPADINNDSLLECGASSGTLGSYETLHPDLVKNVDYTLVPPPVWDVLYECYGGGPPLPRMILPPSPHSASDCVVSIYSGDFADKRHFVTRDESDRLSAAPHRNDTDSDNDGGVEVVFRNDALSNEPSQPAKETPLKLPKEMDVVLHPWIITVHPCDPSQPYRRGDVGWRVIHVMATPGQPLSRFVAEVVTRLRPLLAKVGKKEDRMAFRLWKKIDDRNVGRYGPWVLLCKNRMASCPLELNGSAEEIEGLRDEWEGYADNATVEGVGLTDNSAVMFEYANHFKNGVVTWPREAAAKAGRMRRLADEDAKFRKWLCSKNPRPGLVGTVVDAMDGTGRWYQAAIADVEDGRARIDFGGLEEWIELDCDRLAVAGRYTMDSQKCLDEEKKEEHQRGEATNGNGNSNGGTLPAVSLTSSLPLKRPTSSKSKIEFKTETTTINTAGIGSPSLLITPHHHATSSDAICPFPSYGATGLSNLGNTCYANAALQCLGYVPLLRAYILSGYYKSDVNKDNPLGSGGKLLEDYADLMRVLWSGRYASRAPTRFRAQLGKTRPNFAGNDQQDAQELLNTIIDALHEDSSLIKKKPLVPPLADSFVTTHSLPKVGLEAWRRYMRRNRSIVANIAYGQVLNKVTCPVCNHSSLNFDPFNMLSIPFPTVTEVNFEVTVYRRATANNTPCLKRGVMYHHSSSKKDVKEREGRTVKPYRVQRYLVSMSRLADIADLKQRLQQLTSIPASRLKLCKTETIVNDTPPSPQDKLKKSQQQHRRALQNYVKIIPLPDKQGPCLQLAKSNPPENSTTPSSSQSTTRRPSLTPPAPTPLIAFESTLRTRPLPPLSSSSTSSTSSVSSIDDENNTSTSKQQQQPPSSSNPTTTRLRHLQKHLHLYGDSSECRHLDTDPTEFSRAMSRSLWPHTSLDFKLGIRVDAIDHRDHWFPGSVVEIIEGSEGKVRVHFDNFSTKWDEVYDIGHFRNGSVRPLYSHATPRGKPLEILCHHRHGGESVPSLFGQSFFLQCHNEWSTARAGAHVLAQAVRFLPTVGERGGKSQYERMLEESQSIIAEVIRVLIEIDRRYVKAALNGEMITGGGGGGSSVGRDFNDVGRSRSISSTTTGSSSSKKRRHKSHSGGSSSKEREDSSTAASMTHNFSKRLGTLLPRLPFDVRVCAADQLLGVQQQQPTSKESNQSLSSSGANGGGHGNENGEVAFPFSLVRTIGNYMTARHAIVLHWRGVSSNTDGTSNSKEWENYPILYRDPKVEDVPNRKNDDNSTHASASDDDNTTTTTTSHPPSTSQHTTTPPPLQGGMNLGVCLTEFCKEQHLPEGWKCPKCKVSREGKQSMSLWRLPDVLTFHIKRFNCSARWREKISTRVDFPLTGLDMKRWCDEESPERVMRGSNGAVYDLIGVINHLGGMTGGHYVAACKATLCHENGREEVSHVFNGVGVNRYGGGSGIRHPLGRRRTGGDNGSNNNNHNNNGGNGTNNNSPNQHHDEEETVSKSWLLGATRRGLSGVGSGLSSVAERTSSSSTSSPPSSATPGEKDGNGLHRTAVAASRAVADSPEPLWLQFDDDLVEPIPPSSVVSEGAYVLFYRRRRLTPSNMARYSTLD